LAVRGVSEDTNAFRAPLSHLYASQLVRQRPSRRVVVAPRDLSETNADLDVAVVRRHIGV
jgi:hypothetical protein